VVRLVPSVAQRENLISNWTWGSDESNGQSFPVGSVQISAKYDINVPRAHYEWPEGSL
jgi:hypothetical protein